MLAVMTWKYDERYRKTRDSGNREKTKNTNIKICTGGTQTDFDRDTKLCVIEVVHRADEKEF